MQWIASSEKNADNAALKKHLWDDANQLRTNAKLKALLKLVDLPAD